MSDSNLLNNIGQSVPIAQHEYCGSFDNLGLRSGRACELWIREYYQKYQGNFFLDNLHGEGVYVFREGRKKVVYNGKFYSNLLEGYAGVIYSNGSFEGLFKAHRKFGPGVRNWMDGTQDVGLWNGSDLMRLSSVVRREWVPSLAKSAPAKTRLLKYKNLVPIVTTSCDIAKQILTELNANEEILSQSDKLYNICIRHPESVFFNKKLYDDAFFTDNDCFIEVSMTTEEEKQSESESQDIGSLDEDTCCGCGNPYDFLLFEINDGIRNVTRDVHDVRNYIAVLEEQELRVSKPITVNDSDDSLVVNAPFVNESEELGKAVEPPPKTLDEIRKELHETRILENVLSGLKKDLTTRLDNLKKKKKIAAKTTPLTKPVFVTDLLPWNNEKLSEDILKHCFLHKNSEETIDINITDILAGNRKSFGAPGVYERNCTSFLEHCSEGHCSEIINLLQKWVINPDITDAKGNSGLTFAAARDKIPAIKVLINYGAKVDIMNDEGLTPLTMCLLRYIAVRNGVTDWENAFNPQTTLTAEDEYGSNIWQLPECSSSLSSVNKNESETTLPTTLLEIDTKSFLENKLFKPCLTGENVYTKLRSFVRLNEKLRDIARASECFDFQLPYAKAGDTSTQGYILSTDCVIVGKEKPTVDQKGKKGKGKSKKGDEKAPKSPSKSKKTPKKQNDTAQEEDKEQTPTPVDTIPAHEHDDRLDIVQRTIMCLLSAGSDPNIGIVPLPVLLLSVFTKNPDVVDGILKNKAEPNIITTDESLNALHILVSMPPFKEAADMCCVLINHGVDKNARTSSNHWLLQKSEIVGKYENEVSDTGKTPLHLLCMRYDFKLDTRKYLCELATALVNNKVDTNEFYLGHTPLSLAILRGNLELIRALLETKRVNPNQALGENMGAPLTVLILKRYADILPVETCFSIYDLLVKYSANPLDKIEEIGNAIEFMEKEHEVLEKEVKPKGKGDGKGKKKQDKSSKKSKSTKKSGKGKKKSDAPSGQEEIKNYLIQCARNVLWQRIQCEAVKHLYDFIDTGVFIDDFAKKLARTLTPEDAVNYLQLLVHNGKIKRKYITFEKFYYLVELVREQHLLYQQTVIVKEEKPKKKEKGPKKGKKVKSVPSAPSVSSYAMPIKTTFDLLESLDIRKLPKRKPYIPHPCLDSDKEKYKVCFYCCKKQDKDLRLCPECEMVYYCSQECNTADNKLASHRCGIIFCDNLAQDETEKVKPIQLRAKVSAVRKVRLERKAEYEKYLEGLRVQGTRVKPTKVSVHEQFLQDLRQFREITEPTKSSYTLSASSKDNLESEKDANLKAKRLSAGQESIAASTYNSNESIKQRFDIITTSGSLNSDSRYKESFPDRYKTEASSKIIDRNTSKERNRNVQRSCTSTSKRPSGSSKIVLNRNKQSFKRKQGKLSNSSISSYSSYSTLSDSSVTTKYEERVTKLSAEKNIRPELKITREFSRNNKNKVRKHRSASRKKQFPQSKNVYNKLKKDDVLSQDLMNNADGVVLDSQMSKLMESNKHRRIPKWFQFFLEQISKCIGDLDMSQLFLPYACYSDGQLYYKFSQSEPTFNGTYSFV